MSCSYVCSACILNGTISVYIAFEAEVMKEQVLENSNRAQGLCGIHTRVMKVLKNEVVELLTELYNSSFNSAFIPENYNCCNYRLKKALGGNYRPISFPSIMATLVKQ